MAYRFFAVLMLCFAPLAGAQVAAGKMVFMREFNNEKQIVLANNDGQHLRTLTSGNDWHVYPDISADGSTVVYAVGSDGDHLKIVTQDLRNGSRRALTTAGQNFHPRFSGDARFVAYSGNAQIHVLNLASAQDRVLAVQGKAFFPQPASDGHFVIFQQDLAADKRRIVLYNMDDQSLQVLSDPNGLSMSPSLSADDRWVAYASKVNDNWDVYVTDLFTHQTVRVTEDPAEDFAPAFRADGTLVFASDRSGDFQLYQVALHGLTATPFVTTPLVLAPGQLYSARFSGDTSFVQGVQSPMPTPARSSFGVARVGDRIYIAGGHQGQEHNYPADSFLARVDYFDLKTHIWGQTRPRPVAAHGYCLVANGKYLYAFGGFTFSADHDPQWKSLAQVDRLDTEAGTWKTVATMTSPRSSNVAVRVRKSVYLIGGWDSTPQTQGDLEGRFLREIDVFDLTTEKISRAAFALPDPLRRAFSAVSYQDKIILVGGLGVGSSHFSLLANVTELDPATGQWNELAPLPFATFAPAAQILAGSLYVFGGMFSAGGDYDYVSHIYSMDLLQNQWRHTGRYLAEPKGFAMVAPMSDHELAVLGGHSASSTGDAPTSTFETFAIP